MPDKIKIKDKIITNVAYNIFFNSSIYDKEQKSLQRVILESIYNVDINNRK